MDQIQRSAADQLDRLCSASMEVSSAASIDEVARAVLEGGTEGLGAWFGALWFLEDQTLRFVRSVGVDVSAFGAIALEGDSPLAAAVRGGEAVWLENSEAYAAGFAASFARTRDASRNAGEGESLACLPMRVGTEPSGGVVFGFRAPRAFTREERSFLKALVHQSAYAIDRVRLLEVERAVHRAAQEARQTLEAMINASPAATLLLDMDGTVREWNRAAEVTFGWTRAEAIGNFLPYVAEADHESARDNLERIRVDRTVVAFEAVRHRRGNVPFDAHVTASPIETAGGKLQCLATVVDITEKKREATRQRFLAEAGALLARSLDYRATLDGIAALGVPSFADWAFIDLADDEGWFERVAVAHADPAKTGTARAMRRRLWPVSGVDGGVSRAACGGAPHLVPVVTDDHLRRFAGDDEQLAALMTTGIRSLVCAPLTVGDRSEGALTFGSCGRVYDGHDLGFALELARRAALAIDNARLYAAKEAAVQRLAHLHRMASELSTARTPDDVAQVAVTLGARAAGASAASLWLKEGDGSLRLVASDGFPPGYIDEWRRVDPTRADLPVVAAVLDGEATWVEDEKQFERLAPGALESARSAARVDAFAVLPVSDGERRIGVLSFSYGGTRQFSTEMRDLVGSVARQCEQALVRAMLYEAEARARAEAETAHGRAVDANRAKDEFLAMLGHELRNPLAPIASALQVMALRGTTDGALEREVIERQVGHLVRLVNDLLDVARITRGRIDLELARVRLAAIVAGAAEIAAPLVKQRRHRLTLTVPGDLVIQGDAARLTQVVSNLLVNAAKYTPPGGRIDVAARSSGTHVVLTVRDNGCGLPESLLPRVFDTFVQGDRHLDRSEGGLGLGLALVRSLVELHGGSVTARSEGLDRGAEFEVTLPLAGAGGVETSPPRNPDLAPARQKERVLVVDDNVDGCEMLAAFLAKLGYEVRAVHDGPSALAVSADYRPTVALIDIGLPGMSGLELAAGLRATPGLAPPRLIAVTGYGQPADIEKTRDAGFDHHLVKPVDVTVLRRFLETEPKERVS